MNLSVVIDSDPGVDDFLAILMAARSEGCSLLGLTTVGGNVPLRLATRNALKALAHASRSDVPVAPGASRPFRGWFRYAPHFHGRSGLTARLPSPPRRARDQRAEDFIVEQCGSAAHPVVLISLGPLTNIARLLLQRPSVVDGIDRLVIMGGAIDCPGNITPTAEFNIWNDPQAADIVLRSGVPTTLVGLDVCRQVSFSRAEAWEGNGTGHRLLRGWFQRDPSRAQFDLCDPLAVAVAMDSTLAETEKTAVRVKTEPGPGRGATERSRLGPKIDVSLRVDVMRARRLIKELVLG